MSKLEAKDIRVSLGLLAVLIFASVGLYALNKYRPSADNLPTTSTSSSSTANTEVTDSSPFPSDTTDSVTPSDTTSDSSSTDNTDNQPTAPEVTTATSGAVSADQSSALLDKQCISADGKDIATIDVIVRDANGNILIGDGYKPQINVDPKTGLAGNVVAGTSNDWLIQLKSTTANQVTAKVGSQNVLITTLTLNFANDCPVSTATTDTSDSSLTDTTNTNNSTANQAQNITKAASSKINPIYYIGGALVLILILVGGVLIFLKRRMSANGLPQDEVVAEAPAPNPTPPTSPPTNPPVPPAQG